MSYKMSCSAGMSVWKYNLTRENLSSIRVITFMSVILFAFMQLIDERGRWPSLSEFWSYLQGLYKNGLVLIDNVECYMCKILLQ